MSFAIRRVSKELERLTQSPSPYADVEMVGDDIFHWEAILCGPADSPYSGGRFVLDINFLEEYPFRPPTIIFMTQIYHPNVDSTGKVCLHVLHNRYSAKISVGRLLFWIWTSLKMPMLDPEYVLNDEVCRAFQENKALFDETAASWTQKFAM